MQKQIKLLDCTLRDGGYYTNWDFDKNLCNRYFDAMDRLPVEFLEIGYRSKALEGYYGEYFYLPISLVKRIKHETNKKLVIILNEKDVRASEVEDLLGPVQGLVDMVRIAIQPENLLRARSLALELKNHGFMVGFNVMYMSTWNSVDGLKNALNGIEEVADYFYMVDSYGGVFPDDVVRTIELVREVSSVPLGFHGHNNLELALINTITAIDHGVEIVDSTITGMGRGAGNLKTELLLTYLNQKFNLEVDFSALSTVVDNFTPLQIKYGWGTNLPYMVSGANSLPQKEVMEWVSKRYYPLNSIVQALNNQKNKVADNASFPVFREVTSAETCYIIGGGASASEVSSYVSDMIKENSKSCIIHASSRNVGFYKDIDCEHYFCLVGNEGNRLEQNYGDLSEFMGTCVLPPYPRKMGSVIPDRIKNRCFELSQVNFTDSITDAHTSLALQTALDLGFKEAFVIGYDGYAEASLSMKEQELFIENEVLFKDAADSGLKLVSLTPTRYDSLIQDSIYSKF